MTFPLYTKINSIQKRHTEGPERGRFTGEWAQPEFAYLADSDWIWREKVDGTNIRIHLQLDDEVDAVLVALGGRTDKAQIPDPLYNRLLAMFYSHDEMYRAAFDEECLRDGITLFGEGFGEGIQKGGAYGPVDFILFDVLIGNSWMTEESTTDIAGKLGIERVPLFGIGTLNDAIAMIQRGWMLSRWSDVKPEGLVCVPEVPLFDRRGHRIITKIKHKDFQW